ncbi:hypothetical protein MHBO_001416 [Bonamia ostreae]|uniref:J domain-containing protein n=1 Tax=Bonamia ostreae TaxID=126728 RepID=A0ABV2AIZ0_9EUKA
MQIYASNKIFEPFTQILKGFDIKKNECKKLSASFLKTNKAHLEQINFRPSTLWPDILKNVEEIEKDKAKIKLLDKLNAHEVKIRDMRIEVMARKAKLIYVPAYVINYDCGPFKNNIFLLNGLDKDKMIGIKTFNPFKIGSAVLAINSIIFYTLSGFLITDIVAVSLLTIIPAVFSGWLSRLFSYRQTQKLRKDRKERNENLKTIESSRKNIEFDDEESFGYFSNLFNEKIFLQNRLFDKFVEQKRAKIRMALDKKGYYALLGLDPSTRKITQEEVHSAFKKKARTLHPDRFTKLTEKEIVVRNEVFKEIIKAYQILKDEKKRSEYDRLQ